MSDKYAVTSNQSFHFYSLDPSDNIWGQRFPESSQRSSLCLDDDLDARSDLESTGDLDGFRHCNEDVRSGLSDNLGVRGNHNRYCRKVHRSETPESFGDSPAHSDSDSTSNASSSEHTPSPQVTSSSNGPLAIKDSYPSPSKSKPRHRTHADRTASLLPSQSKGALTQPEDQSISFSKAVITKFNNPPRYKLKKIKFHQCNSCQKSFPRPSGLRTHMNTHTNTKPHFCPFEGCEKSFSVISNAKRHYRTHLVDLPPEECLPSGPYTVNFSDPVVLPSSPPPPSTFSDKSRSNSNNWSSLSNSSSTPQSFHSSFFPPSPLSIPSPDASLSPVRRQRKRPSALRWLPDRFGIFTTFHDSSFLVAT